MDATIYIIRCKDKNINEVYIGSTNDLKRRIRAHKYSCNNINANEYSYALYQFIRANGGWNNWEFCELEKVSVENKQELFWKERENIAKFPINLNMRNPISTQKDKRKDMIKWGYKKFDCDCGGRYTLCNKAQHFKSKKHIKWEHALNV